MMKKLRCLLIYVLRKQQNQRVNLPRLAVEEGGDLVLLAQWRENCKTTSNIVKCDGLTDSHSTPLALYSE